MFVISCSGGKHHLWLTLISKGQSLILIAHNDALEDFLNRGHLRGSHTKLHRSRLTQQCRLSICLPAEGAGRVGGVGVLGGFCLISGATLKKHQWEQGRMEGKNRTLSGRGLLKQQKQGNNTKVMDYVIPTSFRTISFDYFFVPWLND